MDASPVSVVVEDDADISSLVEAGLSRCGFAVFVVSSSKAGVEAVRVQEPAIVPVDWGLPDIDGFEVIRRILRAGSGRLTYKQLVIFNMRWNPAVLPGSIAFRINSSPR